jgi:amino acid transporter
MQLQRSISSLGLLFTAVGGIVGSGWLFGPMYAAQLAGPAAIISWMLGGVLMLFIAFTFAELATAYPRAGGMVHFGRMSHGPVVSFTIGWMIWLSSVVVAPVETLALLQYSGNYVPGIMHTVGGVKMLTAMGIGYAAILMALMVMLNSWGAKFFSKSSAVIVTIKLGVPILTLIVLFSLDFHVSNFHQFGGFAPFGWKGIITALPLGGVVFAFIGYSPAIQLAGEAKNPQKAIPFAILGAVSICIILYVLIQMSFIGAMTPAFLAKGWNHLSFVGDAGPFAGVLTAFGVTWLVVVIYADAFISPFGTAYIYTASTSRVTYALSEVGLFGKMFAELNKKGVPVKAMLLNFFVGMLLFLPFHAWQAMVEFLISCFIIAYSIGPVALYVMRKRDRATPRPFRLPFYPVMTMIAFYVCNMLLFWTGWKTIQHLLMAIAVGVLVLIYKIFSQRGEKWLGQWKQSWWLIPYIAGIGVLTYLGSFGGGKNVITFGVDFFVMAAFSLVIFWLAVSSASKAAL